METGTGALSASELADLAGVTEAEVNRMVGLGILVTRDGAGPFLTADAQKIRLATACEQAGLPMDGIASAIRAGRLSFTFLEASPFGAGQCAREGPTGRSARRRAYRWTRSAAPWSPWGSPGWRPTS